MNNDSEYILQIKKVRKEFPGILALNDVSFNIERGKVHALIGENGAGKSTIMKILAGIYPLDSGEILLNGKQYMAKNPADALNKGISMIHQELDLVLDMTVEQNISAGREPTGFLGTVNKKKLEKQAQKLLDDMGLNIRATSYVRELSVAQMQMVAIAKATSANADLVIMDEPTSAITDKEVDQLFEIIARLKKQNKSVIYISHRLEEIFKISDMITVLRDGCHIETKLTKKMTRTELVRLMVGRELKDLFIKESPAICEDSKTTLKVEGLTRHGEFEDVNFEIKKGEILGFSGLMGAGRTEVMETIFGLRRADKGTIYLNGKKISIRKPKDAIKSGIAFISEDRKIYGLNLIGSVRTNMSMAYMKMIQRLGIVLNFKKERELVDEQIKQLKLKTPNREFIVNNLSGGNQQKVIVGKWLIGAPEILIMDEPTRGIDVGAKVEIYRIMDNLAKQGKSIIMISSEMPELLGMSDRIIVLCQGKMTGEFIREECSQERLMACAINEGGIY